MRQISPRQLADWLADRSRAAPVLIDVRETWEFALCRIEGSRLLPMQSVPGNLDTLETDAEIVVVCHHGMRSQQVASFLEGRGFTSLFNLSGGVHAWATEVDPAMPTY